MNTEKPPEGRCRQCGRPVESGQEYCAQCMIERAEENIPESADQLSMQGKHLKSGVKRALQWIILLVCLVIIAFQVPRLTAALKTDPPIRQGTNETDAETDRCIANLWLVARLIQDNEEIPEGLVCPLSGKPYVIQYAGDTIIARCPNPEKHGFSEITVSNNVPCPKLKP